MVIISLVRAQGDVEVGTVGFLEDVRRMNVAITRPRRSLWVVGRTETLRSSVAWRSFVDYAQETGAIVRATPPFEDFFGSSNVKARTDPNSNSFRWAAIPLIVSVPVGSGKFGALHLLLTEIFYWVYSGV